VLDVDIEVAVVRGVVVDALVSGGDEIDEIEDVLSPPVPIPEVKVSADISLTTITLSTSCALTRVMITSKRKNNREAWLRANMMLKLCDRSHKS